MIFSTKIQNFLFIFNYIMQITVFKVHFQTYIDTQNGFYIHNFSHLPNYTERNYIDVKKKTITFTELCKLFTFMRSFPL